LEIDLVRDELAYDGLRIKAYEPITRSGADHRESPGMVSSLELSRAKVRNFVF
jgi:hypothetical protein